MYKDENCLFCNKKFENNKNAKLPETESIIYQDEDFYIIVDIAPLVRGHILIIPNKHIYNFNQLTLQEKIKVDSIKKFVTTTFKDIYSLDTMFFEHGSTEHNNGGGSIDHAHLHCLPYNTPINQKVTTAFNKAPMELNILLNNDYDKNKSYIFVEEYNKAYLYDVEKLPSQFLRKLISDNSSQNEYKWQNLSYDEINNNVFKDTLNDLKSTFENTDIVSYSSIWDNIHTNYTSTYDNFLDQYLNLFDKSNKIIELGCGAGYNSIELMRLGFNNVIASDFSEYIINKLNINNPNLKTMIFDMTKPFPLKDSDFNVVIADLSIHYFDDITTKSILKEIDRILVKGGYLIGRVDSTLNYKNDSKHIEIDENYYFNGKYCKRYFEISSFDKYFNKFDKIALKEQIMSRYEDKKILWEFVYRKR